MLDAQGGRVRRAQADAGNAAFAQMGEAGEAASNAVNAAVGWLGTSFTTAQRLYHLTGIGPAAGLAQQMLVESWTQHEALSQPYVLRLHVLSTNARLAVGELLGQSLVLHTLLADGRRSPRSGVVLSAQALDSDGGLARYALTLGPWSALNEHVFGSGLHQGVPVTEIAERSWRRLAPHADWAWQAEVSALLARSPFHDPQAASPGRRLCSQYRESDHAFVQRLLAEEGIGYAFDEVGAGGEGAEGADRPDRPNGAGGPAPHRLRAFADSTSLPWDETSERDGALRFHQAGATQAQDAVQAWGCTQRLAAARTSVLTWEPGAKRAVAASSHSHLDGARSASAAAQAPGAARLEHYLTAGPGLGLPGEMGAGREQAERAATLLREAEECRLQLHLGRSTVRTLRAGRRIRLTHAPAHNGEHLITAVAHAGFNNLPKELAQAVERRIGAARLPALPRPHRSWSDEARAVLDAAHVQAEAVGSAPAPDDGWVDLFGERYALAEGGQVVSRQEPACGLAADVVAQARRTGYANALCAIPAAVPWRPQRWRTATATRSGISVAAPDASAAAPHQIALHPKPDAPPVTTALVVGPEGQAVPQPGSEIHTDAQGRIRVRLHWQRGERADDTHTPWLRCAQRLAGPGMGWHFTPRIGQEVLVGFLCDDIDQPVVLGALYNGQGEAGTPPTPGGRAAQAQDAAAADGSSDHRIAAQGNRIGSGAGGHAPAWHGAAARSHANAAALSGIKTQEFSGPGATASRTGFNQLVFDDTPAQLRVQLATTQHATQLNLGHLIHQADNHRGSLRGQGWELRTDAWGAVRAARGVLLTTYGLQPSGTAPTSPEPAGDNTAGLALSRQMSEQARVLSQAAATHQTVPLASHQGSQASSRSVLSEAAAPLQALHTALAGEAHGAVLDAALSDAPRWMAERPGAAPAGASNAGAGAGAGAGASAKPHLAAPVIAATARAGLVQTAVHDIIATAQDTVHLATGGHSSQAIGGQGRTHTGQAIGVLAAAIQPGEQSGGIGLSFIAAQGEVIAQAQSGPMQLAAKDTLRLQSASRHIDWTAAKRIVLSVSGGASLTIDGSGITVQCPGKLTIQAGKKSFVGAGKVDTPLPHLPQTVCVPCLLNAARNGSAFVKRV
jgi:uncharacterized protein involved in type VI secretion and phage assembly/uncharacterized protein (DUF2345 family)